MPMRRSLAVVLVACLGIFSGCAWFQPPKDTALYDETFSDPATTVWSLGETESRKKWIEGEEYHVLVKTDTTTWSWNSHEGPFDEVQIDLDVRHIAGTDNVSAAGLVFRLVDGNNLFAFLVSPVGMYRIYRSDAGTWTSLAGWTSSTAINKGVATNHLRVVANGSSFSFFVNGTEVETLTDTAHASGFVGVVARAYDENVDVHVAFDNLQVHSLD
jgi:hypothetical protein